MAVFGLVLLILGFVLGVPILWNLGMLLLIIGLALWNFGTIGHVGSDDTITRQRRASGVSIVAFLSFVRVAMAIQSFASVEL